MEDRERVAESILVVEDDEFLAKLLKLELAAAGYGVLTAADGEQALAAAFERCPELVLADLMMPHMDGLELTRRLRADPRTEGVSIIMLTARGMAADKLEGLTAGADDYIVKPFEHAELIARVGGVLRRAKLNKSESPLTGLPGNVRIEDEIQGRIDRGDERAPAAESSPRALLGDADRWRRRLRPSERRHGHLHRHPHARPQGRDRAPTRRSACPSSGSTC